MTSSTPRRVTGSAGSAVRDHGLDPAWHDPRVDLSTVLPYVKPALDLSAPLWDLGELHDGGVPVTPVLFDGNLEVSVMLLDDVWESFAAEFGTAEILAVAPCRSILAFCPASSVDGRTELEELIERVWRSTDHPLTKDF